MRLNFAAFGIAAMVVTAALASSPPSLTDRLIVHEWGTFTVLQDEQGNVIGGVNTDDEPVPPFVHSVNSSVIRDETQAPSIFSKGVPACDRSVWVRLETPVIYFHAPPGHSKAIDVDVAFHGGWLTQFYPNAQVDAPELTDREYVPGRLTDATLGKLGWHNLRLVAGRAGPRTTDPVWLWPRQVEARDLTAENGESERFIFYRGVGHVKTPLRVLRTEDGKHFEIRADLDQASSVPSSMGPLWLVDVRDDGKMAMRSIARIAWGGKQAPLPIDASFTDDQYSSDLTALRRSLRSALVGGGLYDDEADALLNTWETSYFRRPGLRLFYLVPRGWTDRTLPMRIGEPGGNGGPAPEVRRLMVGRIELVKPEQRRRLAQIAKGPASNPAWLFGAMSALGGDRSDTEGWLKNLADGTQTPGAPHVDVPTDYRAYLELGRFRNALILEEESRRPTPALKAFIQSYALGS